MPPPAVVPHLTVATPALHNKTLRMSYRIARGEQGVLTFEPYKSAILPHWRFRTVPIAKQSASTLWQHFLAYDAAGDFVGQDMTRKFIQMGCTRAARYANYKGGRKYDEGGVQKERSKGHEGKEEKRAASEVFREVWGWCREHEGYRRRREEFQREQKEWDRGGGGRGKVKEEGVKTEDVKAEEVQAEDDNDDKDHVKQEDNDDGDSQPLETDGDTAARKRVTQASTTRTSKRVKTEDD